MGEMYLYVYIPRIPLKKKSIYTNSKTEIFYTTVRAIIERSQKVVMNLIMNPKTVGEKFASQGQADTNTIFKIIGGLDVIVNSLSEKSNW